MGHRLARAAARKRKRPASKSVALVKHDGRRVGGCRVGAGGCRGDGDEGTPGLPRERRVFVSPVVRARG